MTIDELFFFDGKPEELALYEALLDRLAGIGEFAPVVHKTQISLKNRRVFACVSMLRVLPKKLLPPRFIVLTLGLPYPLDSPRIAVKTEAQPNRWTHHIVIGSADESFLVKGTIPHSVWNNQEDETVMIGITVK